MVELRKRKATTEAAPPSLKKVNLVKDASTKKADTPSSGSTAALSGDNISLDGFGGEVQTQDGVTTTLKNLVEDSKNGVVIFTYPKASTPGCTTQACLFRDDYSILTTTGFSIYGLSTDSPKSNTNFKTKQNLPYTLLCDPAATLIKAIGLKKSPSGTIRGVFVVNKEGKIEAAAPGSPGATVGIVRKLVDDSAKDIKNGENDAPLAKAGEKVEQDAPAQETEKPDGANGEATSADVAAEVADTAEKLDNGTTA